jgi:hypothetical protein
MSVDRRWSEGDRERERQRKNAWSTQVDAGGHADDEDIRRMYLLLPDTAGFV